MHPGLALIGAICLIIAGVLTYLAVTGIAYLGSPLTEASLGAAFFALAALFTFIAYKALESVFFKVKTGAEALIGKTGVAATDLDPKGPVRVMGEYWQATAQNGAIKKGEAVKVTGIEGMTLIVETLKENT